MGGGGSTSRLAIGVDILRGIFTSALKAVTASSVTFLFTSCKVSLSCSLGQITEKKKKAKEKIVIGFIR